MSDKTGIEFAQSENLTLGVELELQLVSRDTYDLSPVASQIIKRVGNDHPFIKPEIFESMIELNTDICRTVSEVRADLRKTSEVLSQIVDDLGVRLISAGSHPFARYSERILYPSSRYKMLIDRNQHIARRLMIFGIHVHVGMTSADLAMKVNNAILFYLPHLLALSASSPFWQGDDTGLASSRTTVFEAIPTGGHPCRFQSWEEFTKVYERMVRSGAIASMKDIWWDVRPSPAFGTLEIRCCDGPPSLDHVLSITALIQALCARIIETYEGAATVAPPEEWIMRENKWRASRHGLEAKIITSANGDNSPIRVEILKLLEDLAPYFQKLGSVEQQAWLQNYCRSVPSYQKQREIFSKHGTLAAVTESLADDFSDSFLTPHMP